MGVMERKFAKHLSCISKLLLLSLTFLISHLLFSIIKDSGSSQSKIVIHPQQLLTRVYVADLPREFNFGLLETYWKDEQRNKSLRKDEYPDNPLLKQHSAEFWLLRELESEERNSPVIRVWDSRQADVIFVPFFAALSAQMVLRSRHHGIFTKRNKQLNLDFARQQRVVEIIKSSPEWKRSNGMDHVFVLADPMAMWHVRSEISASIFLVVDFGGWYIQDAKTKPVSLITIQHTQVSPIKDVIVPHTHLLPTLEHSKKNPEIERTILLYFRGARHRHRKGLVREQLWKVLENEPGVVLEESPPDAAGLTKSTQGMRGSVFCLSPAGDTPSSCRLYDAIASLCIPVVVSDDIQLPFEGFLDYELFSVFVSTQDAVQPGWLVRKLRSIGESERYSMRKKLGEVQRHFEYDNGDGAGRGPAVRDGAVSLTWLKIHSKVAIVKESVARYRRWKNSSSPAIFRCHCVS